MVRNKKNGKKIFFWREIQTVSSQKISLNTKFYKKKKLQNNSKYLGIISLSDIFVIKIICIINPSFFEDGNTLEHAIPLNKCIVIMIFIKKGFIKIKFW